jgi:hypothetical protein
LQVLAFMFANDLFLGHVPFPRTLTRSVRPYASVIIRRFSSKSALSISPRAKRSFRISMAVGEVSRVTRLSLLRRRGPQHKHHILDLRILIAPLAPLMWIDVWFTSRAASRAAHRKRERSAGMHACSEPTGVPQRR